jgi:hypothetical protein
MLSTQWSPLANENPPSLEALSPKRHCSGSYYQVIPDVHGIAPSGGTIWFQLICDKPRRKIGVPMSLNSKSAWILGGTLLVTAASTLAGCASTPFADSRSAEKAALSQEIDGSINPGRPEPNVWHVLRDAMVDLNDAGISFNPLLLGPILIRTDP